MERQIPIQRLAIIGLIGCCGLLAPAGSTAQSRLHSPPLAQTAGERVVLTHAADVKGPFAPVVERVAPSIVNIVSDRSLPKPGPLDETLERSLGIPPARSAQVRGSGVLVRPDGIVITADHIVEGGQNIRVLVGDRNEFAARLLRLDRDAGVAILKLDGVGLSLPFLPIPVRDELKAGDPVFLLSDPRGHGVTVAEGVVSALPDGSNSDGYGRFLRTDAALAPGAAGGPLINSSGTLAGISYAIYSRTGKAEGVTFVAPVATVRRALAAALKAP